MAFSSGYIFSSLQRSKGNGFAQRRSFLSLLKPLQISRGGGAGVELQPALDHAVSIVKRHDPAGFLPGKLLATEDMQVAYFAVRSFWVETGLRFGSTADVPPNSTPAHHLEWWRQGIEQIYETSASVKTSAEQQDSQKHPTLKLLAHLQKQHQFNKCHFDDILKGRFLDLDLKQYPDLAALEEHAEWSCGSLMQLILESDGLFEKDYATAHRTAKLLGKAHGLTNALRTSIPVMSTTGKLIIPQELCERYGVKSPRYLLSALGQGDKECIQALRNSVHDIANQGRGYLQQARDLRSEIELEASSSGKSKDIMGVFLPGLASETFMRRLEDHDYDLTDRNLRNVSWSEHAKCSLRMIQASYLKQY